MESIIINAFTEERAKTLKDILSTLFQDKIGLFITITDSNVRILLQHSLVRDVTMKLDLLSGMQIDHDKENHLSDAFYRNLLILQLKAKFLLLCYFKIYKIWMQIAKQNVTDIRIFILGNK